jgi:putative restriction endonuclease
LGMYLKANRLGELYPATSFQIGANERIPDLAFVSAARIPPEGEPDTKWPMPPDLAVEVISPNDLYEKVYAKAMEYLATGVKQVWLVSPEHHTITIYRSATHITAFAGDGAVVSRESVSTMMNYRPTPCKGTSVSASASTTVHAAARVG